MHFQRATVWVVGVGACVVSASVASAQSRENPPRGPQRQPPDAATMFRRLDVDGDGKLTMGEARENERRLFERIFDMAGKPADGSLNPDEFRKVFEQVQRGGRPPAGPGGRPPERNGPPNREGGPERRPGSRAEGNRPGDLRPDSSRPERDRPNAGRAEDGPATGSRPTAPRDEAKPAEERGATSRTGGGNRLEGTWRGWVVDGRGERPNAGHLQMELRIEGNRMTARELGQRGGGGNAGLGDGTFQFTGSGTSGHLDATGTSGRHDGVEYLGIFEIDGDTLKWCVGNRGRPRPQEYSTGRQNYYMLLRRVP